MPFCSLSTIKGKSCRNYAIKGTDTCHVHKPKNKKTSKQISFKESHKEDLCAYRNKYGEYFCNNEKYKHDFCKDHYKICKIYVVTCNRMIEILKNVSMCVNTYEKIWKNFANFFVVHKEWLIALHCVDNIKVLIKALTDNIEIFKKTRSHPFRTHKKSISIDKLIKTLTNIKTTMIELLPEKQIKQNRSLLVSNNVKIDKLTHINVHVKERVLPVVSNDIKNKILSYIV